MPTCKLRSKKVLQPLTELADAEEKGGPPLQGVHLHRLHVRGLPQVTNGRHGTQHNDIRNNDTQHN
jgi:hypothetical protein